jgi:hypothetical protein
VKCVHASLKRASPCDNNLQTFNRDLRKKEKKTKTEVRAKVEEGMKVERSRSRITRY